MSASSSGQSQAPCLQSGISAGKPLTSPGRHRTLAGGHNEAAPKALAQRRAVLQAQLQFTFKPGSLGAAPLSLPIMFSSKAKARDALPSGMFIFSKSEPRLPCELQRLLGTLQLPHEHASSGTGRKTAGEGTDTTSVISAGLRSLLLRVFAKKLPPGRGLGSRGARSGHPAPPAAPRAVDGEHRVASSSAISWESPALT